VELTSRKTKKVFDFFRAFVENFLSDARKMQQKRMVAHEQAKSLVLRV
jgi:hypothetical protein